MVYSPLAQRLIAELYARKIRAVLGMRKKVLALDLDNTLWGGILGEDGPDGILLGTDGLGQAFVDTQTAVKAWKDQGIVLVLVSKNDEAVALDVIANHPAMVLRPDDFAAWRINWQDKATNLRELADELSLRLDSFVFLDDSPHERQLVRRVAPDVTVVDLPEDAAYYPRTVQRLPYFDSVTLTDEDRQRPAMYRAERDRKAAQEGATSLEDHLRGLDIHVTVRHADRFDRARVNQLLRRTNQFNLNGWVGEYDHAVVCEGRDIYGTYGVCGAAVYMGEDVRNVVISCRVLGRGVEEAFVSTLAWPLPLADTGKNGAAKAFLAKHPGQPEKPSWVTLAI